MLQQRRDGNISTAAQVPQRGASSVGISSPAWKGKKTSDIFQAVPNCVGYVEPLEDSAWSQNVDSAASMYAPPSLPLTLDLMWAEDYQDLSDWCSKQQPEMAADMEISSFTAQDYELNTPELGFQHDFNFTASCNVLKENSTSLYLSKGWDTSPLLQSPPPLYITQKSSLKEPLKTNADNRRSVTANEFFIDDGSVQSVSHEEEIVTSHNMEGLNLEFVQSKESDSMKKSVNLYTSGVSNADISMDIDNCRSVVKDSLVGIDTDLDMCVENKIVNNVANTDKVMHLGALWGSNTYVTMQNLGFEEDAGKAVSIGGHTNAAEFTGQKNTTRISGTDVPAQVRQQSLLVNSELTGTAEPVEISAKSLAGMSSQPCVAGTRANEDVQGGNFGMQPQMAVKEEGATRKDMQLNLSTAWESNDDISIGISTPDVLDFLLKHNVNFDLIDYTFSNPKEFQQDLPVTGDDRIYVSGADETAKVEPIEEADQSPNDAESLDNAVCDTAVKVEVAEPCCIAEPDNEQDDPMVEPIELVEEGPHCSLEHRSDQLFEGRTRTDAKNNLKGSKGQQTQKVSETKNRLLESRIVQDGKDLRLTISKVKGSTRRTGSKRVVVPQQQVPPREDGSSKRPRGRPSKPSLPSTSEVKNETHTTKRATRRKSCSVDEPWRSPSKSIRLSSGESCDRYRELRDKNNEASRKSRQNRRDREVEMKAYAANLARENHTLKIKADEMEKLVKTLREALLEAVIKTKKQ